MTRLEYNTLLILADHLMWTGVFTHAEWSFELISLQKQYYS